MKDIPTPESDAAKFVSEYITQEDVVPYALSQSIEQRLSIAVAALRKIEINDDCYESAPIASEALAQIEEDKT